MTIYCPRSLNSSNCQIHGNASLYNLHIHTFNGFDDISININDNAVYSSTIYCDQSSCHISPTHYKLCQKPESLSCRNQETTLNPINSPTISTSLIPISTSILNTDIYENEQINNSGNNDITSLTVILTIGGFVLFCLGIILCIYIVQWIKKYNANKKTPKPLRKSAIDFKGLSLFSNNSNELKLSHSKDSKPELITLETENNQNGNKTSMNEDMLNEINMMRVNMENMENMKKTSANDSNDGFIREDVGLHSRSEMDDDTNSTTDSSSTETSVSETCGSEKSMSRLKPSRIIFNRLSLPFYGDDSNNKNVNHLKNMKPVLSLLEIENDRNCNKISINVRKGSDFNVMRGNKKKVIKIPTFTSNDGLHSRSEMDDDTNSMTDSSNEIIDIVKFQIN